MITEERFLEIMSDEDIKSNWDGDNALQGFEIMQKYIDPSKSTLLQRANHDIIYGPNIKDLIIAGITEHDVLSLRGLNWMVEDNSYLACFV